MESTGDRHRAGGEDPLAVWSKRPAFDARLAGLAQAPAPQSLLRVAPELDGGVANRHATAIAESIGATTLFRPEFLHSLDPFRSSASDSIFPSLFRSDQARRTQRIRRKVLEGSSPKHWAYAFEKSPKCQKPHSRATSVTVVVLADANLRSDRARCRRRRIR